MSDRAAPALSVVIAATDSDRAVTRALRALEGQALGQIEILVVASEQGTSSVPRLRRIGLEAAQGRVVGFLEDSCQVEPGWADALIAAFGDDPALVGASGVVEHDDPGGSLLDLAVVFCEYTPFLQTGATGRPARLAGNNFAVRRDLALALTDAEVHESALLAALPGTVLMVDGAVVRHVRRFGWGEAFGDRFRYGLEYGRLRTVGASTLGRWAGLIAGPAIFGAQVARIARSIAGNRRYWGRFAASLPITLALLASWSLGEWLGWSLGPPGRPDRRSAARKRRGTAVPTSGPAPDQPRSRRVGYNPGPPLA